MGKITVDGNTAVANVAYKLSEIATIYPITPSSTMAELADSMASDGVKNIFGNTLKVVEMQSEGGAAGALHGALSSGALATTFTASQGLLLMIPNMYKIAGELLPCVMHVSARTIATHALSIFGDHSDVMACRQTGFAFLASGSVQEAQDLALAAHLATLNSSVPFVHFFDGFRTSHEINTIEALDFDKVKKYVPYSKINEFKNRGLNSNHPHQQGTAQNPDIFFQNREACNTYYNAVPKIVEKALSDVYKITGRKYGLFDYVGCENPEHIIILMGSGSSTAETTVNYLNKNFGTKYGVIKVRLFRPFSATHLNNAIPKSVKSITVLDRTKEPGSVGEPLYTDVVCALQEMGRNIKVYGGRYGLGSKEFTPTFVNAVFENMLNAQPKNHFTIGINDDVTKTSLKVTKQVFPSENVTACKFYGYGGDGTVSANKSSIKIIGNNTKLNGQAYFEYDSKKSGNATISHLRFGKQKINESYLLDSIDFVAVHNQTYVKKYNFLKGLKVGGTLLLNTNWNKKQLEKMLPSEVRRTIAKNKINFYTIDAYSIAQSLGLNTKINLIMQSAFFKLIKILPYTTAKNEMKAMAEKNYGSKGEKILQANFEAIESAEKSLKRVKYPTEWAKAKNDVCANCANTSCSKYYEEFIKPIERLDGDSLPVSAFNADGKVPTGTTQYEKRGIATMLPCWQSENCIQCNMCSFVCPHAAIRPVLVEDKNLKKLPKGMTALNATAENGKKYILQLDPLDCTGCGVCASVCPAKNKALVMTNAESILEQETKNYEFVKKLKTTSSAIFKPNTVKGVGFNKPYFEFSGACAGCGETPYIKVISQLFGDHMVIANATGCSSIYGGSAPTCPYTFGENGGPAWANSLFEDNAEFGLGIKLGIDIKREKLLENLKELINSKCPSNLKELINNFLSSSEVNTQRELGKQIIKKLETAKVDETLKQNIVNLSDSFVTQSVWIIGGDGWAYDIGYGGLDHVLASGKNVNILVLDTEVYSNTGGQASKATPTGAVAKFAASGKHTPKKDLGLMATCYKDVYVAKVSMGADMNQFLKAVTEAEAYDGVSLIIAYAPCINHGINMSNSQLEEKKAVECGYWTLWRYNPQLRRANKNPFILDSSEPSKDYLEFLNGESRYFSLLKKHPERAKELFESAKETAKQNYEEIKKLSE